MRAAHDEVVALSVDQPTHPELLTALAEMEAMTRQLPSLSHRIIARLDREASPKELGAKSLKKVLRQRLRISGKDAARRLAEAKDLGPRTSFTGEPMEPLRARTAAAQRAGTIGSEHVEIIRRFFSDLPIWVDAKTRTDAEETLVDVASGFGPDELRKAAKVLAMCLDPDGPMPDDAERARRRSVVLGPQQPDGMSRISGWVDPQGRATLEPIFAKLAAPGMCNPNDEAPCTSGTPSQEQIDGDDRSYGQRAHDALTAIGRMVLMSKELGKLNGLPVTVIVTTTLQELHRGAGFALTAGGSMLPMSELIRMASHAFHYLSIFDEHSCESLYLARTKRLAQPGQRIVLLSRDHGCTFPGCPVSGYGSQVHHVNGWAKNNGQTNVDEMVLACGGDNRLAEEGWTVHIRDGIAEWIPPPELDTGQARVNFYHHPARLLAPPDEPEP